MKTNMTRAEAAEYLGLAIQTLADWAHKGTGPVYAKMGNARKSRVLYSKNDLDLFISEWKVSTIQMQKV